MPVMVTGRKRALSEAREETLDHIAKDTSKPPRTPRKPKPDKDEDIPVTPSRSILRSGSVLPSTLITPSKCKTTYSPETSSKIKSRFGTPLTPCSPTVKRMYSVVHSATGNLGGNGYNGPIYGELTRASMQRVIDLLKEKCELGPGSSFIDIGSGLGKPSFHVAEDTGCELSFGIELEKIRYQLAIHNQRSLLRDLPDVTDSEDSDKEKDTSAALIGAYRTFFMFGDALHAKTFNPFTHVYMCDIGFPPATLTKLGAIFNRSKSPYLINYHAPRYTIAKYGFKVELMEQFSISLHGSGESHTMYLYKRITENADSKSANELNGGLRIDSIDPFWKMGVHLARGGGIDNGTSLKQYVEKEFNSFTSTGIVTRSRSTPLAKRLKLEF